jgi:hypothetical protein
MCCSYQYLHYAKYYWACAGGAVRQAAVPQVHNHTHALMVRARPLRQKAWAMAVQALLLAATVTLCVVIGHGFELAVGVGDAVAISVALMLMGLRPGRLCLRPPERGPQLAPSRRAMADRAKVALPSRCR